MRRLVLLMAGTAVAAIGSAEQPVITPSDTTEGYLKQYGIDVIEHFVTTKDYYILRMFNLARPGAPVVLLQHGILASSWCWLVNTPERSLGILLWEMGYDVWLTNSRGNTYSRNHTKYRPLLNKKFWDYTFTEMGNYDVIANVQYILSSTRQEKLTFVGWSQGATQMFIAAQGEYKAYLDEHINLFVALSPVTYMRHQTSKVLGLVKDLKLGAKLEKKWPYAFLNQSQLPEIVDWICNMTKGGLCSLTVDDLCGTSKLDDIHMLENLAAHFPAGTSVKNFNHYKQFISKQRFGRYDYGSWQRNLRAYLRPTPADFKLSKLGIRTALFMGSEDALAHPADMIRARAVLKNNPNVVFSKEYAGYSHVTWLVGTPTDWIDDLIPLLNFYARILATLTSAEDRNASELVQI